MIYYLFSYKKSLPGVNNKVVEKVISLSKAGLNIRCIVLYNEDIDLSDLPETLFEKHFYVSEVKTGRLLRTRFLSFLNSAVTNYRSTREIYKRFLSEKKIDFLILRYGTADFSIRWLIEKLNNKVIFESNTNELEQLKLRYRGLLKTPAWITYDYLSEKFLAAGILRKTSAIVCVTNELSEYQRKRIKPGKLPLIETISNGIDVSEYDMAPPVPGGDEMNLLMLIGVDSPWHGLDKIVNAILASGKKMCLYVVGNVTDSFKKENIKFVGQMNKAAITQLIIDKKICCGIGTLALERKGIKEAAPLKVREYIARGLPVVYSYEDTDLDKHKEFRDTYCVRLKYGSDINADEIYFKVKAIISKPDYHKRIREFAARNLDVNSKALQYKTLIEKLVRN